MSARIDTEGPRFYVSTIEGYPIHAAGASGAGGGYQRPVLVATVIDSFYGSEPGRFASDDPRPRRSPLRPGDEGWGSHCACGNIKTYRARNCVACRAPGSHLGRNEALAAAVERCAELNAWHEREGWGE